MSALEPAMHALEAPEPTFVRHRLTVHEYSRMAEVGVLAPDARVELIEGEIVDRAPIGTRHYAAVARLHRLLERAVLDSAIAVAQSSLRLGDHSEPEPDLVLLKPRADFYASALPSGHDCLLVIEVSDTTLAYDLRVKAPLYDRHGVPEYWVLDLQNQTLHRHSQPRTDGWQVITLTKNPGRVPLPGLPGIEIDLAPVLG